MQKTSAQLELEKSGAFSNSVIAKGVRVGKAEVQVRLNEPGYIVRLPSLIR